MKNRMDMTSGSLGDKIIKYAIPLAATGILQQLFNAADLAVVGQFSGKAAMAAVGGNAPVIGLLVNLFVGISLGSNVIIAKSIGQKDTVKISKAVHTSVVVALLAVLRSGIKFAGEDSQKSTTHRRSFSCTNMDELVPPTLQYRLILSPPIRVFTDNQFLFPGLKIRKNLSNKPNSKLHVIKTFFQQDHPQLLEHFRLDHFPVRVFRCLRQHLKGAFPRLPELVIQQPLNAEALNRHGMQELPVSVRSLKP